MTQEEREKIDIRKERDELKDNVGLPQRARETERMKERDGLLSIKYKRKERQRDTVSYTERLGIEGE